MSRYAVFAGESYYPLGGWDDFVGRYATLAEAKSKLTPYRKRRYGGWDWAQIVDLRQSKIVAEWRRSLADWCRPEELEDLLTAAWREQRLAGMGSVLVASSGCFTATTMLSTSELNL